MCDTTFTFGQRGNHFFQCRSRREYARLPRKLTALLSSHDIQTIHHVTLGHENTFFLSYRDKRGSDHIESLDLPKELHDFIYAPNRNIPLLRITLGSYNTSFFAGDGTSYLWMNLPPLLLSSLQARIKNGAWTDKPRIVALGADANFLLITEKNAAVWELSRYRTVSHMLEFSQTQEKSISEIQNVVLHPYRYQCFIAQSRNGTLLHENLPPHEVPSIEAMREPILRDCKEVEKKLVKDRGRREEMGTRRPSLQHQATLRKDWGERKQEFTAQTRGLRLSLSLSVSARGISAGLGKMLG